MRIIHTADWHLCNRLGRIDRTADLKQRIERVAALCEEKSADVLLIAGDLFSEYAELEHLADAFEHIHKTFTSFFQRGGTILAITGNHDRDHKINAVRSGMILAVPFAGEGGILAGGRMYLINGRTFKSLRGADGNLVQFVLLPYPFPSRYDLSKDDLQSKEQMHTKLHAKVAEWVQKVPNLPDFDKKLPTVIGAHLHVRGSEIHTPYKMNAADDVMFEYADLNPGWAYVALGHIHKPQLVMNLPHVRYSGSLDRLDFGETHEDHGVLFVEVGPQGSIGEPERLPIPATPFLTIALVDVDAGLPLLKEQYPESERAIVRVNVSPHAMAMSRDEATRTLRNIFPRLHELNWLRVEKSDDEQTGPRVNVKTSLEESVRGYLDSLDEFQAEPEIEKVELRKVLNAFLNGGAA